VLFVEQGKYKIIQDHGPCESRAGWRRMRRAGVAFSR
jgi:hypothetical protein